MEKNPLISENVIFQNICHEVMRECTNNGLKISERFTAYYMKLLLLDPKWNIFLEKEEINRIDLQNLVKCALQMLMEEKTPSLVAIKMQLYFLCSFDTSRSIITKHREDLRNKLSLLEEEILTAESTDEAELEKLFKKIIYFTTLYYGLGNPADPTVYKEAYYGLRSVFDSDDLNDFVKKNRSGKSEQLFDSAFILAGVRLFNRDCNKGGEGIEDIPTLLTKAIEVTHGDLEKTLTNVMERVNIITTALDCSYVIGFKGNRTILEVHIPSSICFEHIEYLKDVLLCYRQLEMYCRKMLVQVDKLEAKSEDIFDNFQWCLIEVHRCVEYKTAVLASSVYPLFTKLANIWTSMQDMVIYLSKLNQILINLNIYMKLIIPFDDILKLLIDDNPILTDADRLSFPESPYMRDEKHPLILSPSQIEDFDDKPLELLGFCIWKFVETEGALIPGNPNNGVIEIDEKYYVFSSAEAAEIFVKTPRTFILESLEVARKKPEFAHFLELYDVLDGLRSVRQLVVKAADPVVTHEVEIQTDLHPETRVKNSQYKWNIWDWKRHALSMADISKRFTRSTQTIQSNCRNAVKIQTHMTKDHCYQTKKDNYSNVPTLSNYVFGLRGRKDDKQFSIDLTRPVDE